MAQLNWSVIVYETRGNQHCKRKLFGDFIESLPKEDKDGKLVKIGPNLFGEPNCTMHLRTGYSIRVDDDLMWYIYPDLAGSDDYVISTEKYVPYNEACKSFMYYDSEKKQLKSIKDFEGVEYSENDKAYDYWTWDFDSRNRNVILFSDGLLIIVISHRDGANTSWGCSVFVHDVRSGRRSSFTVDGQKLKDNYINDIHLEKRLLKIDSLEIDVDL